MSGSKKTSPRQKKRAGYARPLGQLLRGLTRPIVGERGIAQAKIVTGWGKIVGENLARHSQPEKIVFPQGQKTGARLDIRISGGLATEMQHLEPIVIDRINAYFGYRAVDRIRLIHAALTTSSPVATKKKKNPGKINPEEAIQLRKTLESVENPELRAILERLGEAILRRKNATRDET